MALSLFEFSDYKKFIRAWIQQAPNEGRGLRKSLADAIGCQMPFITHVLSGDNDFSLEQAEACGRWMGLSDEEIEFLLLLVIRRRAGTRGLEKIITKQMTKRREGHAVLKQRLQIQDTLSREDQFIYYGSWIFASIHMAVMNPELQTVDRLSEALKLPIPKVLAVLDFLQTRGLLKKEGQSYKILRPMLHLEADSPAMRQHHTSWRLKALDEIGTRSGSENLHYSGVMSLSIDDFEWFRERLSALLEEAIARLKDSKDEKLACLNFDWFSLS